MKLFISRIVAFTIAFTFIMGGTLQFTSIDFLSPVTAEAKRDKDKDKDKVKDKEGFENFWNLYDRKAGDKQKCLNKWGALKDEERETIIRIVPEWIKQYPDKQYRPLPSTFLNGQRWNDEILKSKQNTTPQLKR